MDGVSAWNTRLLLVTGEATLVNFITGDAVEGFVPDHHLVCLFPWCPDATMPHKPLAPAWYWSNTIFTPTMIFNNRELVVLNITNHAMWALTRNIQHGNISQLFFVWLMEEIKPLPLTSDPAEKMSEATARLCSRFVAGKDGEKEADPQSDAPPVVQSGNADGGAVAAAPSGSGASSELSAL